MTDKLTPAGFLACSLPGCRREAMYVAMAGNPSFRHVRKKGQPFDHTLFRACGWKHYDVMSNHLDGEPLPPLSN